ncbi:M20 family metallopeptidase [Pragia fontium]|uniref:Acetylornithine deacetylase/Succinyl-diaminopimelate desuccinylase n=2 Tax=Pragia fontium TaxID=82985 RepID=A0AAJ4WAZ4_9GAMM|nr:M20 family metallopeptidase [Pragia fontium]AKJ42711.1 hypothetical protein QQ39_11970 [Pragia fontium]SFC90293.1 Acetylornithine deacetylase/Succinyl-diaminopimelate desuccinylase [Pragia fontium DSM 5563 = ATCC 49100]SUB83074.1 peptidase, ArgE/DapE family [Pragia fontium]VEJ55971.1 peptidase, ArgE/DapE family [Pragia fontium]GKX62426.1 hypothetical protein SOASR032_09950 [Pragia fontium]
MFQVLLNNIDDFFKNEFKDRLAQKIAYQTESQKIGSNSAIDSYLDEVIAPELTSMGFTLQKVDNPIVEGRPLLIAERIEDAALPTVLCYGHGDVVWGDAENWRAGLSPWQLVEEEERWYGRGSADNKGQHAINLSALQQVYHARQQRLGFNCKILFEMGEEISSPGLAEIAQRYKEQLKADVFIASDGPRLNKQRPTLFLGSRGCVNFSLSIHARQQAYHSGNWGGLLTNPGTQLANAIASLVSASGAILVEGLKPPAISQTVRQILSDIEPAGQEGDPEVNHDWGEAGLTAAEKLFAWNSLEVLAYTTGNPQAPMNAIPARAQATCQLRFVVGTDYKNIAQYLRQHLDQHGFTMVDVEIGGMTPATRFDPADPLVNWTLDIMQQATNKVPALLPNLGGSLPNDIFSDILGLPTLWIPHSYPACGQHAVNEHMLKSIAYEGLHIMARLFWQLGEQGEQIINQHKQYQATTGKPKG